MEARTVDKSELVIPEGSIWGKLHIVGLVLGIAGLGVWYSAFSGDHARGFYSYHFGYTTMLSLALGCMAFVLIQYVVRAGWSMGVRRIAENGMMTLPVFALLFIPVALGAHDLFHWTHVEHHDKFLKAKAPYLNETFFYVRAGAYFVLWTLLAGVYYKRSVAQDAGNKKELTKLLVVLSPIGIAIYALSQTFAAFDWLMSLQPHWYSTIFGVYFFAGSMLFTFSFMVLVLMGLQKAGALKNVVTTEHYHDLGKFMFGFTVFWAYIGFSQFMLIWYANIPEEVEFYYHRLAHGWETISWIMPVTHFFVPFLFLLSRHVKRHRTGLAVGAVWIILMHIVDVYWLVMPNYGAHGLKVGEHAPHMHVTLGDVGALIGVFGIFLAVFGYLLKKNSLAASGDPRFAESLAHENY